MIFELNNEQRKHLGLIPVEKHWELVKLNNDFLYFDGDIIRKKINVSNNSYFERELNEQTAENRTILLPKTANGKPKKLYYTAMLSFSDFGVYFKFEADGYIKIANYTTQTSYFLENLGLGKTIEDLKTWLNNWANDSTEVDLNEIETFKLAERKHFKFKEGDFFAFKIDRRNWGFGRILIDVAKLKKEEGFKQQKNHGLNNLMGKALIVKVYHKTSSSITIDINELLCTAALPTQAIMDNNFIYGQYSIIGHQPLLNEENDMLISYGCSISRNDPNTVYLQYGLIYKETDESKFAKYLIVGEYKNPYQNERIGFGLNIDNLQECIETKSNIPFWKTENFTVNHDLRNPKNAPIKHEIFTHFGLDADKSYFENLKKL